MMHPVGSLSPAVYWRRRLLVGASVVLTLLTLYVACSGSSGKPAAAPSSSGAALPATTGAHSSAAASSARPTGTASRPSGGTGPVACAPSALKISAVTSAPSYAATDQPTLMLQVVNLGSAPCATDLSDSRIELLVYNGESRVWGSHDCQIEPGTSLATLAVGAPVRRSIVWTGLSSQPQCAGTRQRVGAGTYTLHARLGGVEGATTTFAIR